MQNKTQQQRCLLTAPKFIHHKFWTSHEIFVSLKYLFHFFVPLVYCTFYKVLKSNFKEIKRPNPNRFLLLCCSFTLDSNFYENVLHQNGETFRRDSCYCKLFKDIKIGTLMDPKVKIYWYLPELIMSCFCLNYFLNHKLFTEIFASTIHCNWVTCQSKFNKFLTWI